MVLFCTFSITSHDTVCVPLFWCNYAAAMTQSTLCASARLLVTLCCEKTRLNGTNLKLFQGRVAASAWILASTTCRTTSRPSTTMTRCSSACATPPAAATAAGHSCVVVWASKSASTPAAAAVLVCAESSHAAAFPHAAQTRSAHACLLTLCMWRMPRLLSTTSNKPGTVLSSAWALNKCLFESQVQLSAPTYV